jgi:type II secretory pathway component GspD/PulD (secretin)
VIRSVLGGILGVNYIIGDAVTGTLTFRSERRFSQTELLQVMADILARRGYMIQFFNGIYHIGLPAEQE